MILKRVIRGGAPDESLLAIVVRDLDSIVVLYGVPSKQSFTVKRVQWDMMLECGSRHFVGVVKSNHICIPTYQSPTNTSWSVVV
jgi:hypothetical protein